MTATLRPHSTRSRLCAALLLAVLATVAGCQSSAKLRDSKRATPENLYKAARKALDSNDYEFSIKQYEALTSRFPFSDEARQARLDLIYVYYRKGENESATDAAEQFLRENPTHPRVDYAWYMKGLIDFEHTPWRIERWFGVDSAKRPPASLSSSIAAFGTVVRQYPKSEYAHDAQRRMTYLRNRLAQYEINVARYYYRRGAYVAAANRAMTSVQEFQQSPSAEEALYIMSISYDKLGLAELRDDANRVLLKNYPNTKFPSNGLGAREHAWWQFW